MPALEESLLRCHALEKSFSGVRVLKAVSVELVRGEILCIAGENGAGKSTLMNLIGGVHRPDSGQMWLAGESYSPASPVDAVAAGIAFVHQELNLFPNLSICDNIFLTDYPARKLLGIRLTDRSAAEQKSKELLAQVGLDKSPRTLVEELSQGDRQLVEIAKALHIDARVIIFDEPTTSLTSREIDRLFAIIHDLRGRGIAILYISHALEHVMALADRIAVLRDGAVAATGARGDFTIETLIESMVGRSIEQLYPVRVERPRTDVVLRVESVSEPGVVERVTFDLHAGEILGIAGLMGSGRSELARILFGLERSQSGAVQLDGEHVEQMSARERIGRGLAFVTESRREDGLFLDASVDENISIVHPQAQRTVELLRELHITCAEPTAQPVIELSGGNQQKVVLAKWLARPPRVLILDEPTRGIDVGAKQEIYILMAELAAKGMGLLIISSEVEELVGMCDRILVMAKGELRGEFPSGCTREQILRAAV
jgi:ABC-type sugar transport system ATPase subunit